MDPAFVGLERDRRRLHVGGLRVVDVRDAVALCDELEPVGDPREALQSCDNRIRLQPAGQTDGGCGHRILEVVDARQRDGLRRGQWLAAPPELVLVLAKGRPSSPSKLDLLAVPLWELHRDSAKKVWQGL